MFLPVLAIILISGAFGANEIDEEFDLSKNSNFQPFKDLNLNSTNYIVNGAYATTEEFPWVVTLRYQNYFFCGGSLISRNRVLTAAHCVVDYLPGGRFYSQNLAGLTVVAGSSFIYLPQGLAYPVAKVVPHPYYDPRSYVHDIAIVKLIHLVNLSPSVGLIDLPTVRDVPQGSKIDLAGFGVYQSGNAILQQHEVSPYLRKTTLTVMDNNWCQQYWDQHTNSYFFRKINVFPTQICTATVYGRQGVCSGDSGSGLIYNGQIVGVVSIGEAFCASGVPDISTRVISYKNFIEYHLKY